MTTTSISRMLIAGLLMTPGVFSVPAAGADQSPASGGQSGEEYVIGPEDQLEIWALGAEELSGRPIRIDQTGSITLPMIGRLNAGGLTPQQLENQLRNRLEAYVREPLVSVTVTEFHSRPVSVLGAVRNPGVFQVKQRKTLVELLGEAGGPREDAGDRISITRRLEWGSLPLDGAKIDHTRNFAYAELALSDLVNGQHPDQNLFVHPHDVISVPPADRIFVIGAVGRSGGFFLRADEEMTVLKALSLAEGISDTASAGKARILRRKPGMAEPAEIAVNLKRMLAGERPDMRLEKDDIVFVPTSTGKMLAQWTTQSIIQAVANAIMWRTF